MCAEAIEPKTMTTDDGDEVGVCVYLGEEDCIIPQDVTRVDVHPNRHGD